MDSNNDNKPTDQPGVNGERAPVQAVPQPTAPVDVIKTEAPEVQTAPPQEDIPQLAAEPPESEPETQKPEETTDTTSEKDKEKKDIKKEDNPLAITKQPDVNKHNGPTAAIVAALVIAVALIALTIFAYIKTNNTSENTGDSTAATQQEETVQPVTAEDVDSAAQEIDQALNEMDASQDFPDEINDESLGL